LLLNHFSSWSLDFPFAGQLHLHLHSSPSWFAWDKSILSLRVS
jgi:hypothetical protein